MQNFEFSYNGKNYWYSRAVVCLSAVIAPSRTNPGTYCILANRRGTATKNEQHAWNLPVGYLDFDETCQGCAAREIYEETGVEINPLDLNLYNVNSVPDQGNQDICFRYYVVLNDFAENNPTNTENAEENEVEVAKWISLADVDLYDWAWNHLQIIKEIVKAKLPKQPYNASYFTYEPVVSQSLIKYTLKINGRIVKFEADTEHYSYYDSAHNGYCKYVKDTAENNFKKAIEAYKSIGKPKLTENMHPKIKELIFG